MARSRKRRAPVVAADSNFKGDESGHFAWKLFPGQRKICRQCGREPLRIQDVGEHRRLWPSQETQFLCKDCMKENVRAAVEAHAPRKRS